MMLPDVLTARNAVRRMTKATPCACCRTVSLFFSKYRLSLNARNLIAHPAVMILFPANTYIAPCLSVNLLSRIAPTAVSNPFPANTYIVPCLNVNLLSRLAPTAVMNQCPAGMLIAACHSVNLLHAPTAAWIIPVLWDLQLQSATCAHHLLAQNAARIFPVLSLHSLVLELLLSAIRLNVAAQIVVLIVLYFAIPHNRNSATLTTVEW